MACVIIRGPRTGQNAQVWLTEPAPSENADAYEIVTCPSCARVHLLNKITGKLLGDKQHTSKQDHV